MSEAAVYDFQKIAQELPRQRTPQSPLPFDEALQCRLRLYGADQLIEKLYEPLLIGASPDTCTAWSSLLALVMATICELAALKDGLDSSFIGPIGNLLTEVVALAKAQPNTTLYHLIKSYMNVHLRQALPEWGWDAKLAGGFKTSVSLPRLRSRLLAALHNFKPVLSYTPPFDVGV